MKFAMASEFNVPPAPCVKINDGGVGAGGCAALSAEAGLGFAYMQWIGLGE